MSKKGERLSRKEFLKQSFKAGLSLGLLGKASFGKTPLAESIEKTFGSSASSYRTIGRTGIKVMPLGFGAARTMSPPWSKKRSIPE